MIPTTVSATITHLIDQAGTVQAKKVLKYIGYAPDLIELLARVNNTSYESFAILMGSKRGNENVASDLIEACEKIKRAIRNA